MAKKEKEKKPFISLDGEEYLIEDLTNEQKQMINHVNDMQNKLNTNAFMREQLEIGKEAFVNMFRASLETEEAEAEVAEAEA
tara:strand:+ start:61 stop:306 length:246 start_codon:yes stop_codon:yes gene_type:complete